MITFVMMLLYQLCKLAHHRSFLYVFLGLASFVVWTQGGFQEQGGNLALYAINLVLNLAWMPVRLPSLDHKY